MDAVLEPLFQSPRLKLYWEEIGVRLAREAEVRERFYALPEGTSAEFINGEIIYKVADRHAHIRAVQFITLLLSIYVRQMKVGTVLSEKAAIRLTRNNYEPDVCFWREEVARAFADGQREFPPPAIVIEVSSPSTVSFDRGVKFDDYAAHGVEEYWLVDPDLRSIDQFALQNGRFVLKQAFTSADILKSTVIAFEMPVMAAFDEDANTAAVRSILAAR